MSASQQLVACAGVYILIPIVLGLLLSRSEAVASRIPVVGFFSVALSVAGCLLLAYDVSRWAEIESLPSCDMCGLTLVYPVVFTTFFLLAGLACALAGCIAGIRLALRRRQLFWALTLAIGVPPPFFIIVASGVTQSVPLYEQPLYVMYPLFLLPALVIAAYGYRIQRMLLAPFADTR